MKKNLLLLFLNSFLAFGAAAQCGGFTPCDPICLSSNTGFPFPCNSNFSGVGNNIPPCDSTTGSSGENNQWFSFVPSGTSVTITVNNGDCVNGQGIQANIVEKSACDSPVSFYLGNCLNPLPANTTGTLTANNLTPGKAYYFLIDGYAADQCDFNFLIPPAQILSQNLPLPTITGNAKPCKGATEAYSGNVLPIKADNYIWVISPVNAGTFVGYTANALGPDLVKIKWNKSFTGTSAKVCAKAKNTCSTSLQNCFTVNFIDPATLILADTVKTCIQNLPLVHSFPFPNVSPATIDVNTTTLSIVANVPQTKVYDYENTLTGCIGKINVVFDIHQGITQNYGTQLIEENGIFNAGSKKLTCTDDSPNVQTLTSNSATFPDCGTNNATIKLRCVKIAPKITTTNLVTTCTTVTGKLSAASSVGYPSGGTTTYLWSGPGIIGLANAESIGVGQLGVYCVSITYTYTEDGKTLAVSKSQCFNVTHNYTNGKLFIDTLNYSPATMIKDMIDRDGAGWAKTKNVKYSGDPRSISYFDASETNLGAPAGIFLSTGNNYNADNKASVSSSTNLNTTGDADLESLIQSYAPSTPTYDAAVLEFDLIPTLPTVFALEYIFASESYKQLAALGSNDAVVAYISSKSIPKTNLLKVPSVFSNLSAENINSTTNSTYYVPNDTSNVIVFDGMTKLLKNTTVLLQKDSIYHLKIAIADSKDANTDSGIFLNSTLFNSSPSLLPKGDFTQTIAGQIVDFDNKVLYATAWEWDFGDGATSTLRNPTHTYPSTISKQYTVKLLAKNYAGCTTFTKNINIGTCASLFANTTINSPCAGQKNGSIILQPTITAGTTYLWNTGATTSTLSNLAPGYYTVTTTNTNGCVSSKKITLSTSNGINLDSLVIVSPKCVGETGSIKIKTPNPTYTYAWSNGAIGASINNLAGGTYILTITANGCNSTQTITLTTPKPFNIGTLVATNPKCFDDTNGSLLLQGGDSNLTYLWNNTSTSPNLLNLGAGIYTVTVSNAAGCKTTASQTLVQPASIFPVLATVAPKCLGDANGTVYVPNSLSDCSYIWNTGITGIQVQNLVAGTYTITATHNVTGCKAVNSATIVDPPLFSIGTIATTSPKCFGEANGKLEIQNPPTGVTYIWSNNAAGATISNLLAGSYTVTATDNNGCKTSKNITLTQLPAIVINSLLATDPLCFGAINGSIQVQTTSTGLSYVWNTNTIGNILSNVGAGTYSVSISNASGCQVTKSVALSQPAEIVLGTISTTAPICLGDKNGKIEIIAPTLGVIYTWSNGIVGTLLNNLEPGTYSVTGSTSNGCTKIQSVMVNAPTVPNIGTISSVAPTCFGNSNGTITIQNPTAGLTFAWSNGNSGTTLNNLVAGDYTLTVTTATGCKSAKTITLTQPAQIALSATTTKDILCFGEKTNLQVQNPSSNLVYTWSNGTSGAFNANVSAGTYSVTATDATNCKVTLQLVVTEPTVLNIGNGIVKNAHTGVVPPDGSINLSAAVTGGTGLPSYLWSNGKTGELLSNLDAGTYTVTVTDANACTVSKTFTIQLINAVESLEAAGILLNIVPNPSDASQKAYLSVKAITNATNAKCIISDYTGKELSSETIHLVEGARLPLALPHTAGIFVVRVLVEQAGKTQQQSWKVVRY